MNNTITLGEKEYPVRFTWMVLGQVEKETGLNALNSIENIGINDSIALAYYGLKKANPDFKMSIEEVGDAFTGKTFSEVFNAFSNDMATEKAKSEKK